MRSKYQTIGVAFISSFMTIAVVFAFLKSKLEMGNDKIPTSRHDTKENDRITSNNPTKIERATKLNDLSDPGSWVKDGAPVYLDRKLLLQHIKDLPPESLNLDGDNGGYLRSLFFWCQTDEIDDVLAIFAKTQGEPHVKRMYLNSLLSRSIKERGHVNFSIILESIHNHLGDGIISDDAILDAYSIGGFSGDVISELRKVDNPNERKRLLMRMSYSLKWSQDLKHLSTVDVASFKSDEKASLARALALRAMNARAIGLDFKSALDEAMVFSKNDIDPSMLLSETARFSAVDTWNLLADNPEKFHAIDLLEVRKIAVLSMAQENGSLTMKRVLDSTSGPDLGALLKKGITGFIRSNPRDAKEWLEQNKNVLKQEQIDTLQTAFIESSIEKKDYPAARELVTSITDTKVKSNVEGKIWTAERDSLRKAVVKNPINTVQSIVSGQSNYDDYWLEEAMVTWLDKDFDKAQGWYQQNWQTLPANKAQYVAAAFATQAVNQGDAVTARQWLGYIQNPKTKKRIESGIAKAEEAARQ